MKICSINVDVDPLIHYISVRGWTPKSHTNIDTIFQNAITSSKLDHNNSTSSQINNFVSQSPPTSFQHFLAKVLSDAGTGVGVLRTAKFSKIHIKSNFDAVKKSSPFLKRSRAKESQKNTENFRKSRIFSFFFLGSSNNLFGLV